MTAINLHKEQSITHDDLLKLVCYDKTTGMFTWNLNRPRGVKAGDRADREWASGYRSVVIKGKVYMAHRLAWFYVHKEWPSMCIDHINRDKQNNKFENLRLATPQQNSQNRLSAISSSSKFKGVTWHKRDKKWQAAIVHNGKRFHLGYFLNEEEASIAYKTKAVEIQTHHIF
jgi:hypothetical protein